MQTEENLQILMLFSSNGACHNSHANEFCVLWEIVCVSHTHKSCDSSTTAQLHVQRVSWEWVKVECVPWLRVCTPPWNRRVGDEQEDALMNTDVPFVATPMCTRQEFPFVCLPCAPGERTMWFLVLKLRHCSLDYRTQQVVGASPV